MSSQAAEVGYQKPAHLAAITPKPEKKFMI
jgi:hypothetical protein